MTSTDRRTLLKTGFLASVAFSSRGLVAQGTTTHAAAVPHNEPKEQMGENLGKGETLVENGPRITTFLMFSGKAEEAMNFYVALFEKSGIVRVTRYGPNEPGKEGSVQHAVFSLNGQVFMCIDSPVKHDFTFTPAISLYVTCADEAKITRYFKSLAEGGHVLMPLDTYPFSKRFGWVQDRFGVSWQLSVS